MSGTALDMRAEFETDACFGGLPLGPGQCKRHDVIGDYIDAQTEQVFQVWLRGHKSCTVDVRNELMRRIEAANEHPMAGVALTKMLAEWQENGLAAKPPGR